MNPAPSQPVSRPSRPVRRALPLLSVLLGAACPLTACGIPATGVIEAGAPASGVRKPVTAATRPTTPVPETSAAAVPLYFVRNGTLVPVIRTAAVPADPASAVSLLFQGPDSEERALGLTTELPRAVAMPAVRTDGATVAIGLPAGATALSDTAVAQLACTAAAARLSQDPELGTALVAVERPGGLPAGRSSDDCPGLFRPAETAGPTEPPDWSAAPTPAQPR
ncbi:hypothetical protein [Streptomyces sp. NPDC090994]|uniref:hypothetical protein n=1 Tax=Streptomyces sp. NPDC090994 TaxID=3365969 RepID=UPI0038226A6A